MGAWRLFDGLLYRSHLRCSDGASVPSILSIRGRGGSAAAGPGGSARVYEVVEIDAQQCLASLEYQVFSSAKSCIFGVGGRGVLASGQKQQKRHLRRRVASTRDGTRLVAVTNRGMACLGARCLLCAYKCANDQGH